MTKQEAKEFSISVFKVQEKLSDDACEVLREKMKENDAGIVENIQSEI